MPGQEENNGLVYLQRRRHNVLVRKYNPTDLFNILKLQNEVSEINVIRRSPDLMTVKLWKCKPGDESTTVCCEK